MADEFTVVIMSLSISELADKAGTNPDTRGPPLPSRPGTRECSDQKNTVAGKWGKGFWMEK